MVTQQDIKFQGGYSASQLLSMSIMADSTSTKPIQVYMDVANTGCTMVYADEIFQDASATSLKEDFKSIIVHKFLEEDPTLCGHPWKPWLQADLSQTGRLTQVHQEIQCTMPRAFISRYQECCKHGLTFQIIIVPTLKTYEQMNFQRRQPIPPIGHHRFPNVVIQDPTQTEHTNQQLLSTPSSAPVRNSAISVPPPMDNMFGIHHSAPPHGPSMEPFQEHQWSPKSSSPNMHPMGNHPLNGLTNPIQATVSQVSTDSNSGSSPPGCIDQVPSSSDSHQAGSSSVTSESAQSGSDNRQQTPGLGNHQPSPQQGSNLSGQGQNGTNQSLSGDRKSVV